MRHFVWILFALSACQSELPDHSSAIIDTLPNGAVHVRNPGNGVWSEQHRWRISEVLRLGSTEGNGPQAFGSIRDVTLDAYDRAYILDNVAKQVHVFDARGQFVRTIGRQGAGPGELQNPNGLAWDANGRLWVVDPGNARYSVFDTSGTLVRTFPRRVPNYGYVWDGLIDARGDLFELVLVRAAGAAESKQVLVRYTVGADIVARDTFHLPDPDLKPTIFSATSGTSTMYMSVPFAPAPVARFDGRNGLWTAVNDRYRLVHLSLSGDTLRIVEKVWQPEPVTNSEIDEAVARHEDLDAAARAELRSRIPETKPAFETFVSDDAGRLWVVAFRSTGSARVRRVDVFDTHGRFQGQLELDTGIYPPPRIIRDRIVAVTRDDMDVEYVIVYRIEGPMT